MKSNWISKLLSLGGAITVKRTWRDEVTEVRKNLEPADTRKIEEEIKENLPQVHIH